MEDLEGGDFDWDGEVVGLWGGDGAGWGKREDGVAGVPG